MLERTWVLGDIMEPLNSSALEFLSLDGFSLRSTPVKSELKRLVVSEGSLDDALLQGLVQVGSPHFSSGNRMSICRESCNKGLHSCLVWELREFLSNAGILYSCALERGALRSQGKEFLGDRSGSEGTGEEVQALGAEALRLLLGISWPALQFWRNHINPYSPSLLTCKRG